MAGFARRHFGDGVAAFAFWLLVANPAARGAEAPAMLVATRDPALVSALNAAFAPRGVRVALADRPLRGASDDLGTGARAVDLVWLCDVTPSFSRSPSVDGSASASATALCVRPHHGTVIIRRVAVATPLSPEDAAALALSVQVALMPDTAPAAETLVHVAPPLQPARAAGAGLGDPHSLTLELGSGLRGAPDGTSARASLAAVYAPWLAHRLGLGVAFTAGTASDRAVPGGRGPGPSSPVVESTNDLTARLFARAQAPVGPIWLQLDLGPEAHAVSGFVADPERPSEHRWFWSLDGFAGAVVPFGRFFAGARAGGAYLVTGRFASLNPIGGAWSAEAQATAGVGWF